VVAERGFTLLEVVVALLVLELAVVGAAGILTLASTTLGRAERLERASALAEGVLDSLTVTPGAVDGEAHYVGGKVLWTVDARGELTLFALGPLGDTLFSVSTVVPPALAPGVSP